ncbi:UNVERIFIED_CONTAM: Chromatin modification-related protein EAF1 B [Sesamum indicum]
MHGCSSTSVPIVNAEVDSMGRVVEGGVGIAKRTSPLKTAIEKVQAELRQEYGVRDERKRELEFLERGGNPLDFKLGNGASVSVQSTSITDLHPDQIVTSEAKGSFAFTASPHGDSVESSDRPGATPCEPNSADNLMLFDAEQEFSEGGRSFLHPRRSTVVPSDQSFHIDGNRKTQEHGDSAAFGLPRKAYKRRYRSRPNRDGARSGSTDVNPTRGYHASSIPSRHGPRDAQGLTSDTENQHISLDPKPASLIDGNLHKTVSGDGQPDMELDSLKSVESTKDLIKGVPDATLDVIAPRNSHNEQGNQQSLSGAAKTPNQIDSSRTEAIQAIEKMNSVIVGCETSATNTVENQSSSCQINGFSRNKVDEKTNDAQTRSAPCSINLLGSESFCTRTSLSIAGKSDIEMCTGTMNVDSNGNLNNPTLQVVASVIESDKFVKEKKDTAGIDSSTLVNKETASQIQQENGFRLQPEEESDRDKYAFISEVKNKEVEGVEVGGSTRSESGRKSMDPLVENTGSQIETSYDVRRQDSIDVSGSGLHDSRFLPRVSNVSIEAQTSSGPDSFASKIDEDSVLKEAQIIENAEQRWQVDSSFQNEQFPRDHLKKRSDSHQLEYNGTSGKACSPLSQWWYRMPMIKKPKIMRQSQDNSFDNMPPSGGSVPSPVASQISNMSNPNKFIKMLGGRDRGRKAKAVKMPSGHPGSGSPWSLFEDQALVVLAHDLGPNWELVSDAINSTLHFKCIFRKAKECKERHNFLMDRTSGDGADSAEDSGSSQPYPSTLPGIPKGSARQLFQRLQGPMEEDILKSHFEKIIMIGQKQHHCKTQDPRQLQQPHSSHTTAFSQLCPNNLNGGPILTPLDLCDAAISGPDMLSLGYQGPHSGVLAIPNQGTFTPMFPASGASSVLQGSPNMMIGSNLSSSPGPLNSSASKDARYVVPRSGSVSADEQQRIQPYNQMIPGRNIPQPNISRPGALPGTDRGVRILPGGNGMGMMPSVNRGMPMPRPGLQGIPSSSMVNSGSMVSPGMSSANMHAGVSAGQGSSMLRPREALHMMRPGPSQDSQRQMMVADLQMPGNSQGMSQFGGLSSPFPNQSASPPVSSYPVHHQPSHPISPQQPQVLSPHHPHFQGSATHGPSPQQQAYAIRLAKERQLQQRLLQQQPQQQFAASNSLMPHVTSQPQLPISSAMQNSSQGKAQTSSPPVSLSPLTSTPSMNSITQHQQKHQTATQGAVRNAQAVGSGLATQTSKQRQRQQHQFSQANRQHPQQRQQLQAQQQAKFAKGVGRGNLMMHHNIPTESSVLNGVSTNPGNQCSEKGEPATPLVQNQGLYTGSALNTVLPTRQYAASQSPNQSLPQQKMYSSQGSSSSKHLQMTSQSDSSCQGQVPPVAPPVPSTGPQSGPSVTIAGSNHLQAPPHQKLLNQNQSARVVQKNRQINSDQSTKPQGRDADADHHPTSSSTEMDTMTALPQTCNTATNIVQNVSPPSAHKRHASEPLLDSNALNSPANLSPSVSMPSNSSESVPQVGKGVTQRPSASLPTGTDVSVQWQKQHQSQGQQPHSPVPALQQHQQPPVHTQQQAQLLQAGNGNLYGRSNDPR